MSLDSLKLNKQIINAMNEAGYLETKPVQELCVNRFAGGQDWIVVGPEKCGKTSTYAVSIIMKLKYAFEAAPRALILVANREKVEETVDLFEQLAKNTDLRVLGLYPGSGMQEQRDDLFAGTDIVIGTPDRISTIYINSGLNINKVQVFVIDDAEAIIKQGFQNQITRLADCLPKCQRLCFSLVYHDKLEKLTNQIMRSQGVIEIEPEIKHSGEIHIPEYYSVINYKTKLNLLNLLIDRLELPKLIVFCNTRLTAGQLYSTVMKRQSGKVAMFKPTFFSQKGVSGIQEFLESETLGILIISNEDGFDGELYNLPTILHFDIPENDELIKSRIKRENEEAENQHFILFVTDIEMIIIKKIEHDFSVIFDKMDLPFGLVVENNRKRKTDDKGFDIGENGAFHEKKASNAKTVNLGIKDKIKLYGKARKKGNK